MKKIYCLFGNNDFKNLVQYCLDSSLQVFSRNGIRICDSAELDERQDGMEFVVVSNSCTPEMESIGKNISISDDFKGIWIGDTLITEKGFYVSGYICLEGNNKHNTRIFSLLSHYIKTHFHYSSVLNHTNYIGPEIYRNWLDKRISIDFFIYVAGARLHSWMAARKQYYYSDSECVFFFRGKKTCHLIADKRHFQNDETENTVPKVFDFLKRIIGQ